MWKEGEEEQQQQDRATTAKSDIGGVGEAKDDIDPAGERSPSQPAVSCWPIDLAAAV